MAGKQELLHFLDRKVFDPILSASPDRFSCPDQERLTDVQNRTRGEKRSAPIITAALRRLSKITSAISPRTRRKR